jgi:hypothetical protein
VGGRKIFENLKPHELDRLHQVFKQSGKNYNPDCIKIGKEMADIMKCKNVTEFTAVMEYTGVNFINILRAIFCQYFGAKKIQTQDTAL